MVWVSSKSSFPLYNQLYYVNISPVVTLAGPLIELRLQKYKVLNTRVGENKSQNLTTWGIWTGGSGGLNRIHRSVGIFFLRREGWGQPLISFLFLFIWRFLVTTRDWFRRNQVSFITVYVFIYKSSTKIRLRTRNNQILGHTMFSGISFSN